MVSDKLISRIFFVWLSISILLALILTGLNLSPVYAAGVRYATPGGIGDCSSWAKACTLQTALTGATSGDEIWVQSGTYKPTTDTTNRNATFHLNSDVALYGGFAGSETTRDQRDPTTHITILSGDIDNNDSQTPIINDLATVTGNTTNSYHVVTGAPNATGAILDGFTITAGNANGSNMSLTSWGGGMFNDGSSPTLTNVIFSGNSASDGGGLDNDIGSNVTLTNVTFTDNSASSGGGAIYNFYSNPILTNVIFDGNSAFDGGGVYNKSSGPTFTNVTFSNNKTAEFGGGMYNTSSNPALTNVTFRGNGASSIGGGMANSSSSPVLMNVTFSLNTGDAGGGMSNDYSSSPLLTNVTFSQNVAASVGGGIENFGDSNPQIRNTIFWQNLALSASHPGTAQIGNYSGISILNDSVIQDGCPGGSTCTHVISTTPLLGVYGNYGGFTQTIPLLPGSSAIDTGNDVTCAAIDQRGVTRPQGKHCDIGAFETTTPPIINSITRLNPNPNNLANVNFAISFSETVNGVDASDFSLTTTGITGVIVSGVSGSGSTYTVTVNTGSGAGTIRLDVVDDDTIVNLTHDPLGGAGAGNGNYTSGEKYDVRFYRILLPAVLK